MVTENFQEIRLLADEVNRGIVYRDQTGFYNFQLLEGLLKKHGFMTPNYQGVIKGLKKQFGLSDENLRDEMRNVASRWEELFGTKISAEEIRDLFIMPEYEDVERWFKWTKSLSTIDESNPINLSDGWVMLYRPKLHGLQLKKRSGNKFFSILGPRFGFGQYQPEPIFELYVDAGGKVFVNQYAKYPQVMLEVRNKYSEESPLELEIEKSIEKAKF